MLATWSATRPEKVMLCFAFAGQSWMELASCVYRKLDSAISVVKSTEYGPRRDDAKALDHPMNGSVLVQ